MNERKSSLLMTAIILSIYVIVMTIAVCETYHVSLEAFLFFIGAAVAHSIINIIWARYR